MTARQARHRGPLPVSCRAAVFLVAAALALAAQADDPTPVTLRIEADAVMALTSGPHAAEAVSRDRYFRLYHFPGLYEGAVSAGLRFLRMAPGRGTGPHFGSSPRPGAKSSADATIAAFVERAARGALEHPGASYASAGGSFPATAGKTGSGANVMVDPTMKVAHSGAVKPGDQERAADLLVQWLDSLRAAGAPKPGFFSPVNEPDASWKTGPSAASEHARFVRGVALRLREAHPDVRVSGPCTAWPYPGENWKRWEPSGWERAFIETVGDVAGGYDFHLYTKDLWAYGPESPGFAEARKLPTPNLFASLPLGHPEIMEFGKAEVLLDLVQALHLAKWGRPAPPVIISEFGRQGITPQLGPWANDYLSFLYAATVTRLWMVLMDRPEVALTIPFILPQSDAGYGPKRGQALATRPGAPDDLKTTPTPLRDWMAFFREFEGERVPARWEDAGPALSRGLFAVASRNASEIQVLVHNASPEPLDVALQAEALGGWPSGVRVARTRWEGPLPADHRAPTPGDAAWRRDAEAAELLATPALRLEGEETALIRIPCRLAPVRQVTISRHYAPEFLQSLDDQACVALTFDLTPEMLSKAKGAQLVLGFAAPRGPEHGDARLRVAWNAAARAIVPIGVAAGWRQIAVPVAVDIPVADLQPGRWTAWVQDVGDEPVAGSRIVSARLDIRSERPIEPVSATPSP